MYSLHTCKIVMIISHPIGPLQGIPKTIKMNINVMAVCPSKTKNCVKMCDIMTSIPKTPATQDRSIKPS